MAIATINRFISLFTDAFRELSVSVPVVDVERMAMLIHHRVTKQSGRPEIPYGIAISAAGLWVIFQTIS